MEITHKSALFVLRRIRHGLGDDTATKLTGTVEVDEMYVGGKARYRGSQKVGRPGPASNKTPVMGMVERDGSVRFRVLERLTAARMGVGAWLGAEDKSPVPRARVTPLGNCRACRAGSSC